MSGLLGSIVPPWLRTLVCLAGLVIVGVVDEPLGWDEVDLVVAAECVPQLVGIVGCGGVPCFDGVE